MKRAFTLIELLVVVGIMAFLGVAATNGYSALQRGMAERSAVEAVNTLLRAAQERALVDRMPTVVFCYNRIVSEETEDRNAVVTGEAVAVRRAGRVTGSRGAFIVDEFMDAVGSYDVVEDESEARRRKGMRLWRFADKGSGGKINQMEYSVVADAVVPYKNDYLQTFGGWADGDTGGNSNMTSVAYAFVELSGANNHKPQGPWSVGTGYGFEFASLRLPDNFIFGSDAPTAAGETKLVKAFYFDPREIDNNENVDVRFCMPDASGKQKAHHKAGAASPKEL